MITGFNTDVDYLGRVYHVQTEDKGLKNPLVESLIYCGGEIITSRRTSYEELTSHTDFCEEQVLGRMEAQHDKLIRDIRNGEYDPDAKKPFGHNIITNRTLDEVVMCFLKLDQAGKNTAVAKTVPSTIRIEMIDWQVLMPGTRPTVRLQVFKGKGKTAVEAAHVKINLRTDACTPQELFSGETDSDGFVEALFEIPENIGSQADILCEASSGKMYADISQAVKLTAESPG
jgi:hypothetical protein